ncbi:putative disease resistance RPP13-like protein 1 [Prosopis cineraria]|uniref:putative disease resistance RPP13-like protein 1 n=1 Tax=Prosopis cineraria TaxID=364024 RepID=UPI00240FAF8A|nr:putative disease resistance RPP13-like protein 1 [Prosopis cineraria]
MVSKTRRGGEIAGDFIEPIGNDISLLSQLEPTQQQMGQGDPIQPQLRSFLSVDLHLCRLTTASSMAGALVGGAFLSAFLQVAFDRLASSNVLDFFKNRKLNETLLSKLKSVLLSIDAVVDDAEQKKIANPKVKDWIDVVKDVMFDAKDVLDEIDYEVTKCKVEAELQTQTSVARKVRNFFNPSVSSLKKAIESRMKNVLEKLEYLASQKGILSLNERGSGAGLRSSVAERLPTTSLVDETSTYGRKDEKEKIIEWLLTDNDNSQLSVISIVGMGGLGKTTLAQLVYNDRRVMDKFDLKVWLCVSEEFDLLRLTRTTLEAIAASKDDSNNLNMLQIKLKQSLTQKRFLVILDDVWNEDYQLWEALQLPFSHGAPGSKILLTTRSKKVASTMCSTEMLPLELLSQEDSWLLFSKYAFRNADVLRSNFDLEDIGRKINKKCGRLPLAVKTIGSLLHTKISHEQWNGILESELWEKSNSKILPALRLSYSYLPSHLKRCFAYCSLFPKDYDFGKEQLIQLWMAEDFVPCAHRSKDAKEIGEQFFHDLLSRSLFQRSTVDEMHFIMHDLINDLAKDEYGKFCHRLEVDEANNLTEMTRHVSYLKDVYETPRRFKHIVELPDSIGNLKHIRYLDLSETQIRKLPDSISQLYHLQTLKLWRYRYFEKLPMDLHKLMNLRHLDFRETGVREMPKQLGELKNLLVLSSFIVGKCGETDIKQIQELNLCGSVSILELQNVIFPADASGVNLKSKIYLEKLSLEWNVNHENSHDKDVLEKLQPHQNLRKLSIRNYGGIEFPNWFTGLSFPNIVSLKLRNCNNCSSLPLATLLPSLNSLSIIGFANLVAIGPEFYGNNLNTPSSEISCAFPNLQELSVEDCPKLEGHLLPRFPSLRTLAIENCEKLVASLQCAPSLHKLVLEHCAKVQLERLPSTLKVLHISGYFTEILSIQKIKNTIANSNLEKLNFSDCPRLEFPSRYCHNFIIKICIIGSCDSLKSFPLDLFPKLQTLRLWDCSNLEMISFSEGHHEFLLRLDIVKCPKFVSFPRGGFSAPKLRRFFIDHLEHLKSLPERMHILFPSLTYLRVENCPQLESFPEGGLPSNLQLFGVEGCSKLIGTRIGWDLNGLASLDDLSIGDANDESLPDIGLLPPTINSLWISNCPNLRTLEHKDLCHLSSLQHLHLFDCPKLQYLPKEGLPSSLIQLGIRGCPLLKKKVQKQKGKYWAMISHIPLVKIDRDVVNWSELLNDKRINFIPRSLSSAIYSFFSFLEFRIMEIFVLFFFQ